MLCLEAIAHVIAGSILHNDILIILKIERKVQYGPEQIVIR